MGISPSGTPQQRLEKAYGAPFIGEAHTKFVKCLFKLDNQAQRYNIFPYAKSIPLIQSSGIGKSCMLMEVC